jgi:hypothetical protein
MEGVVTRFQLIRALPQQKLRSGLPHGQSRTLLDLWKALRVRISFLFWSWCQLGRISWREIRNSFARIESQLGGTFYVEIGPSCQCSPTEHQISCKRSQSCMKGIQELHAKLPMASPVDLAIFLEGWDRGERFCNEAVHNEDSGSPRSESNIPRSFSDSRGRMLLEQV